MVRRAVPFGLLAAILLYAAPAAAQSFGIGPRFSFVRGNSSIDSPSTRMMGGTIRLMTGKHSALEGTMDYRSYYNEAGTERTKETPMQGSMLLFLARSSLSPYFVGGIGLYSQTHDTLDAQGLVASSTVEKRIGWHLGVGAEIKISSHAAFFVDYRYRFVRFGEPTDDEEPIIIPGTTVFPTQGKVKISHEGSMWTSGMAFYF